MRWKDTLEDRIAQSRQRRADEREELKRLRTLTQHLERKVVELETELRTRRGGGWNE